MEKNRKTDAVIFIIAVVCIAISVLMLSSNYSKTESSKINAFVSNSRPMFIGTVVDAEGNSIEGAEVTYLQRNVTTDSTGTFTFEASTSKIITISKEGYYDEVYSILRDYSDTGIITLKPKNRRTRLMFGGDVALGRRYLAPEADENYPRDIIPPVNEHALIRADRAYEDTLSIFEHIKPLFSKSYVDIVSVNLESPVINNPVTPHMKKLYVFFTLPESIKALKETGVDYVSLANNHIYDYMEQGINSTLHYLDYYGLQHSGAGKNAAGAVQSNLMQNQTLSIYSFTSLTGRDRFDEPFIWVATDSKGGAADFTDRDRIVSILENDNNSKIIQLHAGIEYSQSPSSYVQRSMEFLAGFNPLIVVGHHTHTAQGIGWVGEIPLLYSLGNLAFDSDRHETILSYMALVEIEDQVKEVRLIPIYIENYKPKIISGELAERFFKRLSFLSQEEIKILFENGQGIVIFNESLASNVKTETISVTLTGDEIIDLRDFTKGGYSLTEIAANDSLKIHIGRDILLFGDMENYVVETSPILANEWHLPRSIKICNTGAYRGRYGLCSSRSADILGDSVLKFRKRVRLVDTESNLSFFGYMSSEDSGQISVVITFAASERNATFGSHTVFANEGGTSQWVEMKGDIVLPPDSPIPRDAEPDTYDRYFQPRALILEIRQSPPSHGLGIARYDELAIINWENWDGPITTPNPYEFIRIWGEGEYSVDLKFEKLTR
jgi:poly-gamma-glutamate capsule biosynthesis protein CapA/YwtB (metallophosphatase superfamily)